jgi:hypothetical protein
VVLETDPAIGAGPTGQAGVHGYAVPRTDVHNLRTNGFDRASKLMTQNQRRLYANGAEAAVLIVVKIGAADAASADTDEDVGWPEIRNSDLSN